MARDDISLSELKKLLSKDSKTNLFYIPDLALFLNSSYPKKLVTKSSDKYIVLTARKWLNEKKQSLYERDLAQFIDYVWENYKIKTYFIAMASHSLEDNDLEVADSLLKQIRNKAAFKIENISTPQEVQELLSNAELAICTRMHSAILSTTVFTPFIAIAYEHKTVGYMKSLDLEEWTIDIHDFSVEDLITKFDLLLLKKYKDFKKQLEKKRPELKSYYQKALSETISFLAKG